MKTVKILLVDDHYMIREGLKALLGQLSNIELVGAVGNGKQALEFIEESEVDLVLMDIDMPEMDGIETTRIIQKKHSGIKVLALTMYEDHAHITSMVQSGASGYLLKTSDRPMLIDAIYRVNMGENYFPQEITGSVMQRFLNKAHKRIAKTGGPEDLTPRQTEVLNLIARGLTNRQIAEKLFISKRTVDAHRRSLLEKLKVKNTAGLVRHAVRLNLIEAI